MQPRFIDLARAAKDAYEKMESQRSFGLFSKLKKFDFDNKDEALIRAEIEMLYRDPDIPAGSDCKNVITVLYYCAQTDNLDNTLLYYAINKIVFKNAEFFKEFIEKAKEFLQLSEMEIKHIPAECKLPTTPSVIDALATLLRRSQERAVEIKRIEETVGELKKEIDVLKENRNLQLKYTFDLEERKNARENASIQVELKLHQKLAEEKERNDYLLSKLKSMEGEVERRTAHLDAELKTFANHLKAKEIIARALDEKLAAANKTLAETKMLLDVEREKTKTPRKLPELYHPRFFEVKPPSPPDHVIDIKEPEPSNPVVTTIRTRRRSHGRD